MRVILSWSGAGAFGLAVWTVAIFGSIEAKLLTVFLIGVLMILSLAWFAEEPEDLGHVSEGTRRRYDEPGLRVVGGRRG